MSASKDLAEENRRLQKALDEQIALTGLLRESEQRYRTLFNSMDEGYCVIEFFDGPHGPLSDYVHIEANPAYTTNAGIPDIVGQKVREMVPDEADGWVEIYRNVLLTGQPVRFERELVATQRYLELAAFRIEPVELRQVAVLFKDVTARKRAELQLQESDRRKDEFLATLAHELRNPLAPIRNAVQIMKISDKPEAREKARSLIERQLGQMVRLVDDLMDISRINRNKLELKKESLDLSRVAQNAIETSRPLIDQMGHHLIIDLPPRPVYLEGDVTRLAQVFSNLLNNAAKYTEPGGRIWLTAECQGIEVVVTVRDNGIGIPKEDLSTVFDLFSQVEGTMSQGGLGIGLSLVKRLVEMHGGSIAAESAGTGQGSTFAVRLPVVTPEATSDAGESSAASALTRRRILVVDDNRDGAESLVELLRIYGSEVEAAYDGEEAVAAAERGRPDVILLDLGLPKLDGFEVCRRLREQPWAARTVIIAQTGWGGEHDRQKTAAAGFDAHLVKPIDPNQLLELLANVPRPEEAAR